MFIGIVQLPGGHDGLYAHRCLRSCYRYDQQTLTSYKLEEVLWRRQAAIHKKEQVASTRLAWDVLILQKEWLISVFFRSTPILTPIGLFGKSTFATIRARFATSSLPLGRCEGLSTGLGRPSVRNEVQVAEPKTAKHAPSKSEGKTTAKKPAEKPAKKKPAPKKKGSK